MSTRHLSCAALVAALLSSVAVAQQPPANRSPAPPAFEVASVRENKSGESSAQIQPGAGGRFTATNMPLRGLITFAYQVRPFQIEGAPDWTGAARYDIVAKADREFPPPGLGPTAEPPLAMLMLRTLLVDRFMLASHFDMREAPIYTLSLARADGRLGPQLTTSTTDCAAIRKQAMGRNGLAQPPPTAGDRIQCGLRMSAARMELGAAPIATLAEGLSTMVQRPVIDRTGLMGNYDALLTFQAEALPGFGGGASPPPPAGDSNAPSLFTALQEQLGLKLEPARGPVQMLVIDRIERPVED
jgi:uncharacterized protein (TIGR03435 family)